MEHEWTTRNRSMYWQRASRLTAILLALWFTATFCMLFFARELSAFTLFGWPISFYMAAQGLPLLYLLIVLVYVLRMKRLDKSLEKETGDVR
jgi:putative solute:sodium symporter small subunit